MFALFTLNLWLLLLPQPTTRVQVGNSLKHGKSIFASLRFLLLLPLVLLVQIRNYLKHGNIMGEEEAEAAAEAQKEQVQKFSKAAEAAMKFM